jgi:hypothetical protein
MDLAELEAYIRTHTTDADTASLPSATIEGMANDAKNSAAYARKQVCIERTQTASLTAGSESFSLPSQLVAPVKAYWVDANGNRRALAWHSGTMSEEGDIPDDVMWYGIWENTGRIGGFEPATGDTIEISGFFEPRDISDGSRDTLDDLWWSTYSKFIKWSVLAEVMLYDFEDERSPQFMSMAERELRRLVGRYHRNKYSGGLPDTGWSR